MSITPQNNQSSISSTLDMPSDCSFKLRALITNLSEEHRKLYLISIKANENAVIANKIQSNKTKSALRKVYEAKNKKNADRDKINAMRKKEYLEAAAVQIKAERAADLARTIELLISNLSAIIKQASDAAAMAEL